MAVVNASPDSFSDPGSTKDLRSQLLRLHDVLDQGADIIDIGGQSAITGVPEISPSEEIERLNGVLEQALVHPSSPIISIDTYKPEVAHKVLELGAHIINDISGLLDEQLAELVAHHRSAYVLMHNRGKPKQRLTSPTLYESVIDDVMSFFEEKLRLLTSYGVAEEQIILDPGPDFSKTPQQTLVVLNGISRIRQFGRPVLFAVSRKDFVGVVTGKKPTDRLAGTLGAVSWLTERCPESIIRAHDVSELRDFFQVRMALEDPSLIGEDRLLDRELWRST